VTIRAWPFLARDGVAVGLTTTRAFISIHLTLLPNSGDDEFDSKVK
jgi:hypothetical protein